MENYDMKPVEEEKAPKQSNRTVIGIVAALLVVLCLCIAAVAVVIIDPFEWELLAFLGRGGGAAVEAMPENTALFVGLDMDRMTPEQIGDVLDPFLEEGQDMDYRSFAGLLRDVDRELENEFGITLEDDVLPWIGPDVGIGFVDYTIDQFGGLDEVQLLIVAETQDSEAADDFIEKFIAGIEDRSGESFNEEEFRDVTIYELGTEFQQERIAIARSGDLVYFGTSVGAIEDGLDAQDGDSLGDNLDYRALAGEMPSARAMTVYMSSDFLEDSAGGMGGDLPLDPNQVPLLGQASAAFTLSFVDVGLRMDILTMIDEEDLADSTRIFLETSGGDTADMLPEDTFLYLTTGSVAQIWETILESTPDMDEAMSELEDEIGFDVIGDLIVYLDGETGLGLWPSSQGIVADAVGFSIGFSALAGTSDEQAVNRASGDLVGLLEEQFLTVDSDTRDGLNVYVASEEFSGTEFAFGVGEGYFFIASSEDAVDEVFGEGDKLADSEKYRSVWAEFPGGTTPALYLDLEALLDALTQGADDFTRQDIEETASILGPLSVIAVGGESRGDIRRATAILFLESN